MRFTTCRREAELLEAARSRELPEALQRHASTCRSCSEALVADRALGLLSEPLPALDRFPDPAIVWWRSQQRARLLSTHRAMLPIRLAEGFALACGAVGLAVGLALTWPALRAFAGGWLGSWTVTLARSVAWEGSAPLLAVGGSLLLLVIFGLYSQWAEG